MNRQEEINFILRILKNHHPLNLCLTGSYGSGKTYFVHELIYEIQKNKRKPIRCIKIDLWKYDLWNDPILALLDAISPSSLNEDDEKISDSFQLLTDCGRKLSEFFRPVIPFVKKLVPIALGALGAPGTVIAFVEPTLDIITNTDKKIENNSNTNMSLIDCITEFRKSLAKYLDNYECECERFYIFIDELDRCRPTFAIEFLELIKHVIFNFDELSNFKNIDTSRKTSDKFEIVLSNISYVFTVDINQLMEIVKHTYGSNFDASGYLRRFFKITYSLDKTLDKTEILNTILNNEKFKDIMPFKEIFTDAIRWVHLEPRNIEKLCYIMLNVMYLESNLFKISDDDTKNINPHGQGSKKLTLNRVRRAYIACICLKLSSTVKYSRLSKLIKDREIQGKPDVNYIDEIYELFKEFDKLANQFITEPSSHTELDKYFKRTMSDDNTACWFSYIKLSIENIDFF